MPYYWIIALDEDGPVLKKAIALFRLSQAQGGAYVIAVDEGGELAKIYLARKVRCKSGSGPDSWEIESDSLPDEVHDQLLAAGFIEAQLRRWG